MSESAERAKPLRRISTDIGAGSERQGDPVEAHSSGSVHAKDAVLTALADVSRRQSNTSMAARLLELRAWLADDLAALEDNLKAFEAEQDTFVGAQTKAAAVHLLARRGKQIRPLCVILAARLGALQVHKPAVRDLAVACELVHAATLLHDDVVDNSDTRRGVPASRVLYGNSASILAGDHLLVEALRRVHRGGHVVLVGSLLDVISRMVQAEAVQLERRSRFSPDRDVYMQVIGGKTAALFSWGLEAGAHLAQLSGQARAALMGVGQSLGLAFQLVDDILDLEGDPQETGKAALADLREGKMTWPIILATERDDCIRQELMALSSHHSVALTPARSAYLVAAIKRTGAIGATRTLALSQADAACVQLQKLPDSQARAALELVVRSAVLRIT